MSVPDPKRTFLRRPHAYIMDLHHHDEQEVVRPFILSDRIEHMGFTFPTCPLSAGGYSAEFAALDTA